MDIEKMEQASWDGNCKRKKTITNKYHFSE